MPKPLRWLVVPLFALLLSMPTSASAATLIVFGTTSTDASATGTFTLLGDTLNLELTEHLRLRRSNHRSRLRSDRRRLQREQQHGAERFHRHQFGRRLLLHGRRARQRPDVQRRRVGLRLHDRQQRQLHQRRPERWGSTRCRPSTSTSPDRSVVSLKQTSRPLSSSGSSASAQTARAATWAVTTRSTPRPFPNRHRCCCSGPASRYWHVANCASARTPSSRRITWGCRSGAPSLSLRLAAWTVHVSAPPARV